MADAHETGAAEQTRLRRQLASQQQDQSSDTACFSDQIADLTKQRCVSSLAQTACTSQLLACRLKAGHKQRSHMHRLRAGSQPVRELQSHAAVLKPQHTMTLIMG